MVNSLSIHICPICAADHKNEPLRLKFENDTDFIKICMRCGFKAHFIKDYT